MVQRRSIKHLLFDCATDPAIHSTCTITLPIAATTSGRYTRSMVDPIYSRGKLGAAVQKLATGKGRIKDRLTNATLELAQVNEKVFDSPGIYVDAKDFWRRIWNAITSVKDADPKIGVAAASIDQMSEEEASDVAQLIVSVDAMLGSYVEDYKRGR